jgi:hypothetical protein
MAAGLGFKTFTTGEVLTAADVNGYLMQGVLVFASEAARNSAITSPQEGQFAYTKDNNSLWYYTGSAWAASGATGDIEGVTAGVGISGGGTSGTVTITNSMATAIDAKGDLVAGTGADAFTRLAVGANGTILTADSAETTGLKWAAAAGGGSLTLINTGGTTLSGATTTVGSIPSTYRNLYIVILNYKPATDDARIYVRANADATASRYHNINTATGDGGSLAYNDSTWTLSLGNDNSVAQGLSVFTIYEYANTSIWKMIQGWSMQNNATTTTNISYRSLIGFYNQTTAISSLEFWNSAGNFTSGTVNVYGVL